MPINHTFSIAMCNTKLIFKLSIMIIILVLIAFAIVSTVIMPLVNDIVELITEIDVQPEEFINHPFVTLKTQIIDKCVDYLKATHWQSTVWIIIAVYFCLRFFMLLPQLPVTKVLYNKMSTGYDIGLFNAFVETGFQNILLSFIFAVVTTALNIGLYIAFFALFGFCARKEAFPAMPFVIIMFIAAFSAKACILSQIQPEICASEVKNIFVGMKNAIKGTFVKFSKNFLCFFTLNIIWVAIISATIITTLGAVPIICIPVFIVMRATLSLTLNFSYHRKKYFINNGNTVYTPEKLF